MIEAGQTEQIAITGRISVEPANTPDDMTAAQVATASQRRLENVLVVLEHRRTELETRLSAKLKALDQSISMVTSQLTFAEKNSEFAVLLKVQGKENSRIDTRQWKSLLPTLVSDTFSDLIGEVATTVGLWRVAIAVDPQIQADAGPGNKPAGQTSIEHDLRLRYALIGGLILAICAAVIFWSR